MDSGYGGLSAQVPRASKEGWDLDWDSPAGTLAAAAAAAGASVAVVAVVECLEMWADSVPAVVHPEAATAGVTCAGLGPASPEVVPSG